MHMLAPPAPPGFPVPRTTQNGAPQMAIPPMGTIPLNTLIDFIIHKTYHDIFLMSELLPGKSDMVRKIDIAHFANRTRQLFIRLLAVLKWASSVGKVIKCEEITQYLDQQAMLFVDTADKLHTLANQLVVQARLPNFAIPAAVDVLTTGTYPRLPRAIRDKIVPPDPITPQEKAATLKRLNQIIMFRLVTANIPIQIMEVIVDKGMVKLIVPGEFKAILTLMGDEDDVPWCLLKLEFMVEDRETGSGRALVHDLQINYIHELVQSRLVANEDPLQDLYNVLHSFCLSLQLEVLQAQSVRLVGERWGRLVQIDEYQPGNKVVLSYWRLSPYKAPRQEMMSVTVQQKQSEDYWCLEVTHKPPLLLQSLPLVEKASKICDLSIERLLSDIVQVRSHHKLYEMKQILQKHIKNDISTIESEQSCLVVPLIQPCQSNENLRLSVDPQTGIYVPVLVGIDQATLDEMEKAINEVPLNLLVWIPKFRLKLARERCKTSIQNLPALCMNTLSLSNKASHPVGQLAKDVVYVKLTNSNNYYIVVELLENKDNTTKVLYKYHLLSTTSDNSPVAGETPTKHPQTSDVKADVLVQLETSLCQSEGAPMIVEEQDSNEIGSHFNSELAQIVAISDARMPFVDLTQELSREGFIHQGVIEEGINVGLSVKVVTLPDNQSSLIQPNLSQILLSSLLNFSFRLVDKSSKMAEPAGSKVWNIELVFCNNPLKTESNTGNVTHLMLQLDTVGSESPVKSFKDEWMAILKLYDPVVRLSESLQDDRNPLHKMVTVFSYDYKSLMLKYGNDKQLLVTIKWSVQSNKYLLLFGRTSSASTNSHTIASHFLTNMFNSNSDIGNLIQVLHDTAEPMRAVCGLPVFPMIGMSPSHQVTTQQNAKTMCESFTVILQTATHIRLLFRSTYALDVYCLPNKKVAIRDGSLSRFDLTKVKEGVVPIVGLASFLSLFQGQESRKRSASERDNPPSPDTQANANVASGDMRTISRGIWAGSHPITIPQTIFSMLLRPIASMSLYSPSILELFLGNTLIRRELEHVIRSPTPDSPYYSPPLNVFPNHPINDQLVTVFAAHSLMFRCSMQYADNKPQLVLVVHPVPPLILQERGMQLENWPQEELQVLQQFFRLRVAFQPFRASNVHAFCSIISAKSAILHDFIKVMRLELSNHQNDHTVKWTPQICLTVPPGLKYAPAGVPAVYIKDKILIFIQMIMKVFNPATPPQNRQSITMPIVWYPVNNNIGTLPANNPTLQRLDSHLKQMMELRQPNSDCHMHMAIRYLMENYTL